MSGAPDTTELAKILQKEPAIHTFSSEKLCSAPEDVERAYRLHAETHVEMPETSRAWADIRRRVVDNKRPAVVDVVGDFGAGKTSVLIHIWSLCAEAGIFAVPPFRWSGFAEILETIVSWTRYQVKKRGLAIASEVDEIVRAYEGPREEARARAYSEQYEISFEKSLEIVRGEVAEGRLTLDFTVDDLYELCQRLTELLQGHGYVGFVVIMDELHHAANLHSVDTISHILFQMGSKAQAARGQFGFIFGMPRTLEAALRGDVKDRWTTTILLSCSRDFASLLWDAYGRKFGFKRDSDRIIDPLTLESLGQLTDSFKHRRLANGPRTVVSAFKRVVEVYENEERPYTPFDLVEDCLSNPPEILLGDESELVARVAPVLGRTTVQDRYSRAVKLLAAFPDGCPRKVFDHYEVSAELDALLKEAFRDLVGDSFEGYYLIALRMDGASETYLDGRIKQFTRGYSADTEDIDRAFTAFRERIIPVLFPLSPSQWTNREGTKNLWHQLVDGSSVAWLEGTFERAAKDYPNRLVQLTVCPAKLGSRPEDEAPPNFAAHFVFALATAYADRDASHFCKKTGDHTFAFKLNLQKPVGADLMINKVVDRSLITPLYLLNLYQELSGDSQVPAGEKGTRDVILQETQEVLISSLFDDDLREVHGSAIVVESRSLSYLPDLFEAICRESFPDYAPVAPVRQLDRVVARYMSVLENQRVLLDWKRGQKPLFHDVDDARERRQEIAKVFGGDQKVSAFQTYLQEFGGLVRVDWDGGWVWLTPHPMERTILELLDDCGPADRITVEGVQCDSIKPGRLAGEFEQRGYSEVETFAIIKFGVGRRYFNYDVRTKLIFRKPLDEQERRRELSAKVDEIMQLASLLPDADKLDFAKDEVAAEIESVRTDEQYEGLSIYLSATINAAMETVLSYLMGEVTNTRSAVLRVREALAELSSAGGLVQRCKPEASGSTRWVEALNKHRSDLAGRIQDLQSACTRLSSEMDRREKALEVAVQKPKTHELVALSSKVLDLRESVKSRADELNALCGGWATDARSYLQWLTILDFAGHCATQCEAAARVGGAALKSELASLNEQVDTDLRKGLQTLHNHEQYKRLYIDLQTRAEKVVRNAEETFLEERKRLGEGLRRLDPSLLGLATQFRETNPEGSYDELRTEARALFASAVSALRGLLDGCLNDVRYALEVLGIEQQGLSGCLDILRSQSDALSVRYGAAIELTDTVFKDALDAFAAARKCVPETSELLRTKPGEELTVDEQRLHSTLSGQEITLKQLIVSYFAERGGKMDLESVLNDVKALFKKDRVEIRIRKV